MCIGLACFEKGKLVFDSTVGGPLLTLELSKLLNS